MRLPLGGRKRGRNKLDSNGVDVLVFDWSQQDISSLKYGAQTRERNSMFVSLSVEW